MSQFGDFKGRVKGQGRTETIRPKVELMSSTENPVGTLFSLWHASRHNEYVSAEDAQWLYRYGNTLGNDFSPTFDVGRYEDLAEYIISCYPEHAGEDKKDIRNVIRMIARMNLVANVPSAESVTFNFAISDASVSLREQMVRSKLASYWTQTSRTADLRDMDIHMSSSIEYYGGEEAVRIYKETAEAIREAYRKLSDLGVPVEEIRLAPEARVHRVMWMIDARALLPIISKRLDWMAQATLWSPIISDVCAILRDIDPFFAEFIGKPPVKIVGNKVVEHKYDNENEDRFYGRDPQPVDPLWLAYKGINMPERTDVKFYDDMKSLFIHMWDDEVLAVLGWDRENPSKLGPYDRPLHHPDYDIYLASIDPEH